MWRREGVRHAEALAPIERLHLLLLVDPEHIGHSGSIDAEDMCLLVETYGTLVRLRQRQPRSNETDQDHPHQGCKAQTCFRHSCLTAEGVVASSSRHCSAPVTHCFAPVIYFWCCLVF